jgi:hypothetical protein
MKLLLPLFLISFSLAGQTPQGVAAPWDIAQSVSALSAQAARLQPILRQLTPRDWVAKGASETYVAQWESAQQELGYLADSASALQKQPEKLSAALDTYFRLQSVEWRLQSLMEGVRKYQAPEVGDLLASVMGENSSNRDKLRQYITDLAQQKEQELAVVAAEAQRCRVEANHKDPAPSSSKKKAK